MEHKSAKILLLIGVFVFPSFRSWIQIGFELSLMVWFFELKFSLRQVLGTSVNVIDFKRLDDI